jgi:hypothetical protein
MNLATSAILGRELIMALRNSVFEFSAKWGLTFGHFSKSCSRNIRRSSTNVSNAENDVEEEARNLIVLFADNAVEIGNAIHEQANVVIGT